MSFHVARSSVVMPLLVAIRYRLSPRLTTAVAPYLGVDTREPPSRTTELEQAARTSSASAARPATKMRDGVIPGRFGVIMRLAGLQSGQRRQRHLLRVTRSSCQPLPQFARGHAATADQDTEVDDRSHIGQVTHPHPDTFALDQAGGKRPEGRGGGKEGDSK